MNLKFLMELSPYLEVLIRHAYWRSTPVVTWYNKHKKIPRILQPMTSSTRLCKYLSSQGIGTGNLVILHSNFGALGADNEDPDTVIDMLLKLLGPEGTLAMPAFSRYANEPDVTRIMTADVSGLVLDYDPRKFRVSTGILPGMLCLYPGAVRSLHPLNTMVAIGPLAKPMMENNLAGPKPLPCGRRSSWYFCYQNNAIIVAIGVDLAHTLTIGHVAEDMWDEDWEGPEWYRERKFRIHVKGRVENVVVRERHPKWSMYLAERTLHRDLARFGISTKTTIDGVNVEIAHAKPIVNFLNERNSNGYPYFGVGRRRKCRH